MIEEDDHAAQPDRARPKAAARAKVMPRMNRASARINAEQAWQRALARRLEANATVQPIDLTLRVIPEQHRWSRVHSSHALSVTNTVLFCRRCGRYAAWKAQSGLLDHCVNSLDEQGRPSDPSRSTTRGRLQRGCTPAANRPWPGGAAASETFAVYSVYTANQSAAYQAATVQEEASQALPEYEQGPMGHVPVQGPMG